MRELPFDRVIEYFYRGVVYSSEGDIERSHAEFQRAQQLEPFVLAQPAAALALLQEMAGRTMRGSTRS